MHSFETCERLIKLSVLIALAVLFIVAALSLLTGCETTDQPLVDDDSMLQPVQVVKISPDPNDGWPPKYKVDNMEAYDEFVKDFRSGEVPLETVAGFPNELEIIVSFDGMPQNLRITERPDNMILHRLYEKKDGAELHFLISCSPAHYGGNNGSRITFEWETGSRTLLVWCRDP